MTIPTIPRRSSARVSGISAPTGDPITPLVAAYIGNRWESHYKKAWEKIGSPTGLTPGMTWNWPAGFFTLYWLVYRRRYLYAIAFFFGSGAVQLIPIIGFLAWLLSFPIFWLYGDRIILSRAYKVSQHAIDKHGAGAEAMAEAAAAGGTSKLALFLLFTPAIVIVGILFAIAIPKFAAVKGKAYETMMMSDLRSVTDMEHVAFNDKGKYTGLANFTPSNGVTRLELTLSPDSTAYVATITHSGLPGKRCAVAMNTINPVDATVANGEPVCR